MATLSVRNTYKYYDDLEVLHGINIDINDGEFVALVGPSGCGKSTLLRMIAGLEEISAGEIFIDEHVINNLSPKKRDVAMVFQNYALYPHMTVKKNMSFALRMNKVASETIDHKVQVAAEILNLNELLDRYPRQLSGGQRQRVAMGRAIVRDPKVFLFDEPLSNLDAKLRVRMRTEIKMLHQKLRTTTVYVTHDQIEAMTMADKIVVMRDGNIEQIGDPMTLYDSPENIFVAGFIGSPAMNFFGASIDRKAREAVGKHGFRVPLPPALNERVEEVIIGVRPEDFRFGEEGIPVKVLVVEPTGPETQVVFELEGQEAVAVVRGRFSPAPGTVVKVSAEASKLHFFDSASGGRVHVPEGNVVT